MHALIIEDESLIAMLIEDTLRECGFTSFDVAKSKDEAVAAAKRRCPSLITADVNLDPGSGIEAVDAICAGPPIPVVFVTGAPREVTARKPEHLLLLKPFESGQLIALVQSALASPATSLGE